MRTGIRAQPRLRNPVVHVKSGWQKQGIWKDSKAAGNYPRTGIFEADKPRMNPRKHIFSPYSLQFSCSLLGLPARTETEGTGLLKAQIWGFNSEDEEQCGFNWEELNMIGNSKCYVFPAVL